MFLVAFFLIFGARYFFIGFDGVLGARNYAVGQEFIGVGIEPSKYKSACPDYRHYAIIPQ